MKTKPKSTGDFLERQRAQALAQLVLQAKDLFLQLYFPDPKHAENAVPIMPEFFVYLAANSLARPASATELATEASIHRKSVDKFIQRTVTGKMLGRDGGKYFVNEQDRASLAGRTEAFNQIEASAQALVAAIQRVRKFEEDGAGE